jgi:hypothetical protein
MEPYGFCYVADSEGFVDEALVSIASLREHMPDARVTLITHQHLFRPDHSVTDWVELGPSTRNGPIIKAEAWRAPYQRVLFLDTDTLILDDLSDVFPLLDRFDFACTPEPNARTDLGLDRGVPLSFPELNNAFFAFRKTPAVRSFFERWLKEWDRLHEERGITTNQPAFRNALWQSEAVRPLTLGNEYNLIVHANCSVAGPVKVLHDRSPDRKALARRVNRHIGPRAIIAGFGPVFGYFTRRGWIRQYARLTWHFLRVLLRPGRVTLQGYPRIWWRDGIDYLPSTTQEREKA